jgi:hypothetical protein
MEAYLEGWNEFNVAMMGATAALAGLLIVAASVNIAQIIKAPWIASRLAAGLAGLVLAIVASAVGLIPDIPHVAYGVSVAVLAVVTGVFAFRASRHIYQNHHPANRAKLVKSAMGFVTPIAYLVGGMLALAGSPVGVVWGAVGAMASIVAGILIAWIALVEILR